MAWTKAVKALFTQILNLLTVTIVGQGTVTRTPDQPNGYALGSVVTLLATPASGWVFTSWTIDGAVIAENPTKVTMNPPLV